MLRSVSRKFSTFKRMDININKYNEKIFVNIDSKQPMKNHLLDKSISTIGYGPQGRSQSLNLRDNGLNVSVGVRKGESWNKALKDGWVEGETLFEVDEAVSRGDIVQYLLSDAGQIDSWETVNANLQPGNTLYFSHGFGIVYPQHTGIVPSDDVDVIMVAPKGSGATVRSSFLDGKGINGSYAVYNDYTGEAKKTALSMGFGIGMKTIFPTTFEKEVYSDLTGERCVLMGMIKGAFNAQYKLLRKNGHSPTEAYNETVEEALVSLYPLINDNGMSWLYENCSTTAQRGALDWAPIFEDALYPIFSECYDSVKSGDETKRVIQANSDPKYRENLRDELDNVCNEEIWKVGTLIRNLR